MYSGGEVSGYKTAVGAIKDTALPNTDPSIMPERKPGDNVGAVKDTAGPKFDYSSQPSHSDDVVRINGCGELKNDPCIFINEDPKVQVFYDKMNKPMVVRLPKLMAIPQEEPAAEEASFHPPLVDLSGREVEDSAIVDLPLLPLVAIPKPKLEYVQEMGAWVFKAPAEIEAPEFIGHDDTTADVAECGSK